MARRCGYCGDRGHNRRTCNIRSPEAKKVEKTIYRKKSCGYCSQIGHTRPKCEQMDKDRVKWIADNAIYRSNVIVDMKQDGLGIGAVFQTGGGVNDHTYMVRRIHWDKMVHSERYSYSLEVVSMNTGKSGYLNIPTYYGLVGEDRKQYMRWEQNKVVIRASEEMCTFNIPKDWFDGKDGVPHHLIKKERKKRDEG